MNDETKISPCPYCRSGCTEAGTKMVLCTNERCPYRAPSITAHNAHCALIEKGREYDRDIRQLTSLYDNLHGEHLETRQHLDTAIGLLEDLRSHSLCYRGNEWQTAIYATEAFFRNPAIKAILKQKGQ